MSSGPSTYWGRLLSRYQESRPISTSTQFKMKPYAAERPYRLPFGATVSFLKTRNPDWYAVFILSGMVFLVATLGTLTIKQELVHAPNVLVDKRKRKTLPEVKDPDYVVKKSEEFISKSFFRRLAQRGGKLLQLDNLTPWPTNPDLRQRYVETLKSVGVEI